MINFRYIQRTFFLRAINKIRAHTLPFVPIPYRLPWGGWMLLRNCEFGRSLIYGLYNEQNEINNMRSILRPGMTVFDIGAHQGLFTIVAALAIGKAGKVYAFEPVPSQYRLLRLNCQINRLKNVVPKCLAVSNKVGTAQFFEVAKEQANYSSMKPPASDIKASVRHTFIRTTDLCSYMAQCGIDTVDFIKIDVEGGERDVIEGGHTLWNSPSAPIILLEVNDIRTRAWGYRAASLLTPFQMRGYHMFRPTSQGLAPHEIQENYSFTNVLLVPENRVFLIES